MTMTVHVKANVSSSEALVVGVFFFPSVTTSNMNSYLCCLEDALQMVASKDLVVLTFFKKQ